MTIFTTKTLLLGAALAIMLPLSAQARPYAVCYADTGDAPGCWLSELLGGGYFRGGNVPEPDSDELSRIERMTAQGAFKAGPVAKPQAKSATKIGAPDEALAGKKVMEGTVAAPMAKVAAPMAKAKYQTCKTSEILDMIEKKVPAEKIAVNCYK